MTSQLFAFQLAKPIEPETVESVETTYDPRTQVAVWKGSQRARAQFYCTGEPFGQYCNAYDEYCNTYGSHHQYGQRCD